MMTPSPDHEADDTHPDLVALIREELPNHEALMAGDHLDTCESCRVELSELVVGASIVRRSARTLASSVAPPSPVPASSLPPLALLDEIRKPRRRRRRLLLAAAAVTVLGAVGALTVGLLADGDTGADLAAPTPSATAPSRSIALDAVGDVDSGRTPGDAVPAGRVEMSEGGGRTSLTFVTTELPASEADEFFEAWLLDPTTDKMLPLGLVPRDAPATFEVDEALIAEYSALDLSLEADDGNPRHSATSVLRGSY